MRNRINKRSPPRVADATRCLAGGGSVRWGCHGCGAWAPWDGAEYDERVGPRYVIWNEIDGCAACGAPRSLYWTTGAGTPLRPMKDEWLWLSRELNYGRDPAAWFEVIWFDDPP